MMHVFFDGGVKKIDDERVFIGAGAAVLYDGREEVAHIAKFLQGPDLTNNIAEYEGLLLGIQLAQARGATQVVAYGDSELIVRQVDGRYRTRQEHLRALRDRVIEEARAFKHFQVRETLPGKRGKRRDNNARADALCNQAMKLRAHIHRDQISLPR